MAITNPKPTTSTAPETATLATPATTRLRVATYNVHAWIGTDGRADPERVLEVVRSLEARVIGLQEVTTPLDPAGGLGAQELAERSGMQVVSGHTMRRADADFGNALLTDLPIVSVARHDLSVPNREPRGALEVELDLGRRALRVIVTHLGRRRHERKIQVARILAAIERGGPGPVVVMGDMNEWRPVHRGLRRLDRRLGAPPIRRSYPARWPVLKLDRIWLRPRTGLVDVRAVRTGLSRLASDHLPVVADLALPKPMLEVVPNRSDS